MKIERETSKVIIGGKREQSQFKFAANGHAFKILSDSLYSDKVRAIVRELCTNAWDSHKAAGYPEKPFDVHFPSVFDPFFYVRDYGTGLSHDDVMQLYTTFFESTKNNSNDFIGALGLGSKSPFAYTDQFIIESWFGGEHRSYSAFLGEDGTPQCVHLSTKECDAAESGIKVTLPVENKDCKDSGVFYQKASLVLPAFKVLPNLLNLDDFYKNHIKQAHQTLWENMPDEGSSKFLTFRNSDRLGMGLFSDSVFPWFARQGSVVYPVNIDDIDVSHLVDEDASDEEIERVNNMISSFKDYIQQVQKKAPYGSRSILFTNFNIGDVSIAPSREALSYDAHTAKSVFEVVCWFTNGLEQAYRGLFRAYSSPKEMVKSFESAQSEVMHGVIPKWLVEKVGELPSMSIGGSENWVHLTMDPVFPDLAEKTLRDALFGGLSNVGIVEGTVPVLNATNDEQTTKAVQSELTLDLVRYKGNGRRFELDYIAGKSNFNVTRIASNITNSGLVILCDDVHRPKAVDGLLRKMRSLGKISSFDNVIVLRVSPSKIEAANTIRCYNSNPNKLFECTNDVNQQSVTNAMRSLVPLYKWFFGPNVVILSEIEPELDNKLKEIRKQERERKINEGSLIVPVLGEAERNIIKYANKHNKFYYLQTVGSGRVIVGDKDVELGSISSLIHGFQVGFGINQNQRHGHIPVFLLHKTNFNRVKKLGLLDKGVNVIDFIARSLNTFIDRNPLEYAAVRIANNSKSLYAMNAIVSDVFYGVHDQLFNSGHTKSVIKHEKALNDALASITDTGVEGLRQFLSAGTNSQVSTFVRTPKWIKDEINEGRVLKERLTRLTTLRSKISFIRSHYQILEMLNSVTRSDTFLPRSKVAEQVLMNLNSLKLAVEGMSHNAYKKYPLLKSVSFSKDIVDDLKIYVDAVDAKATSV